MRKRRCVSHPGPHKSHVYCRPARYRLMMSAAHFHTEQPPLVSIKVTKNTRIFRTHYCSSLRRSNNDKFNISSTTFYFILFFYDDKRVSATIIHLQPKLIRRSRSGGIQPEIFTAVSILTVRKMITATFQTVGLGILSKGEKSGKVRSFRLKSNIFKNVQSFNPVLFKFFSLSHQNFTAFPPDEMNKSLIWIVNQKLQG